MQPSQQGGRPTEVRGWCSMRGTTELLWARTTSRFSPMTTETDAQDLTDEQPGGALLRALPGREVSG
jgi:hypothetical protein